MKRIFIIFCFSIFLINNMYANPPQEKASGNLTKRLSKQDGPVLRLGDGYLTYDHMSLGLSPIKLDTAKIFYSGLQSSILLDETIDISALAKALNVDISVSGGWGNFSIAAAANYLHHIENDQFHENFSYTESFYVNAALDISHLPGNITSLKQEAADIYAEKGIQVFTNRYGDTFIQQLPMGAFLVVNLRLAFATAMDKERFNGAISGKFGSIFTADAKIKYAIDKSNAKGTIEISAFQMGGDPTSLANIFAKKSDDGYYITQCSLSNLPDCKGALDGVIRYAQVDFKKQIEMTSDGTPHGNLEVVGEPLLTAYSNRFALQPAPNLDPTIITYRLELANLYNVVHFNKLFYDHFLSSPIANYFTPNAAVLLRHIKTSLDWNWSLFSQFRAIECYVPGVEYQCGSIVNDIKKFSQNVEQTSVDYYINHGFVEINSGCFYAPVGLPNQQYQNYAYSCNSAWLDGSYIFNMSDDKSSLSLENDWRSQEGRHMQAKGKLKADSAYQTYSGTVSIHDLTRGLWYYKTISLRLSLNKSYTPVGDKDNHP